MQLEGASAVQVSTTWTVDDDLQSIKLSFASTFRTTNQFGTALAVTALIIGWVGIHYWIPVLCGVAFFLASMSVTLLNYPRRVRRHRRRIYSAQGEGVYGIDENGVHYEGDVGHFFNPWSAISAFTPTHGFWLFQVVDGTALLIPRAHLTPAEDAAVAVAMQRFAHKIGGGNGANLTTR